MSCFITVNDCSGFFLKIILNQGKKFCLKKRDFFLRFSKQPFNSVVKKKRAVTETSSNLERLQY